MHSPLQRIVHELKKESCPPRVRDQVHGQIAARESSRRLRRFVVRMAVACFIVAACVTVWQWQVAQNAREEAKRAQRIQIACQAQDALGLVGRVLLDAGAHSEKIISDRTVPPLQNSLETTKNKINQYLNL
jgi:hypothetical protein